MSKAPKSIKHAVRLVARHLKKADRGKALFREASECLNQAISLGLPVNKPFKLRDGRNVYLRDVFESSNEAGGYKMFSRFRVEEYKEPKPKKAAAVEVAEEVQA